MASLLDETQQNKHQDPPVVSSDAQLPTVLMVSHAFPPVGHFMASLRLSMFAKYLPECGWRPIILSAGDSSCVDSDRVGADAPEVVRAFDCAGALARIAGISTAKNIADAQAVRALQVANDATSDSTSTNKLMTSANRIRTALAQRVLLARRACFGLLKETLIPDYCIPWYPFAVAKGQTILRKHKVNAIFSTALNVTNHLVALRLSRRFGIPWIADFRDPWTTGHDYHVGRWRHGIDRRIERRILREATRIVTVSEGWKEQLLKVYPEAAPKISIIANGYDQDDLQTCESVAPSRKFTLCYCGEFYGGRRNPDGLFEALKRLKDEGRIHQDNFAFTIIGRKEPEILASIARHGISELVAVTGYLPHRRALARMAEATVGVVITMTIECNRGEMTTKFYECMGLRQQVLALTPNHYELAKVVTEMGVGGAIDPRDSDKIKRWILDRMQEFQKYGARPVIDAETALQFSRRTATSLLAECLNDTSRCE